MSSTQSMLASKKEELQMKKEKREKENKHFQSKNMKKINEEKTYQSDLTPYY